jgi:hypothetical protein
MHPETEPLENHPGQADAVQRGVLGQCRVERIEDGAGELVSPPGPRPLRH